MITGNPFIPLAKTPFNDSDIIFRGLTPDYGKVSMLVRRAGQISRTSYPVADIFRELDIEFNDEIKGEIYTADKVDLACEFGDGILESRNYKFLGRISSFLLKNVPVNVPQIYTYNALRCIIENLGSNAEDSWSLIQCSVVLKMVFLSENGYLPEANSEEQIEFIDNLIVAGTENLPLPQCSDEYWKSLNSWLDALLSYNHLEK